jgi:hypothetical protein
VTIIRDASRERKRIFGKHIIPVRVTKNRGASRLTLERRAAPPA